MQIRGKRINLKIGVFLALLFAAACLLSPGMIPTLAAENGNMAEEAADEKTAVNEEAATGEEVVDGQTVIEEQTEVEELTAEPVEYEDIMLAAAGSTMTQKDGVISWYSSGIGSGNYKNTWKWRVVGWQFSFYRDGVNHLDYYYDTLEGSQNTGTTYYSLVLDDVMADTGVDLKSGNISCIANARIEFRHFNGQSVVDKSFYVDNEADAYYYWRYYGMTPGTGQYGQNCPWQSYYLDVIAGEGVASVQGAGWYAPGTMVSYTGICKSGYFRPTKGSVIMNGNKQVIVTADKQYYIAYDGNGAAGGSMEKQAAVYGEWTVLSRNHYTKQYEVTYHAAGGSAPYDSQKADCIFQGWTDHNDFTLSGSTYHWYTFDAPFYANYNTDVRNIYGYNKEALLTHFINYSVKGTEMRRSSELFQLSYYMINGGSDLKKAFGSDKAKYINHWNSNGYKEHRTGGSVINTNIYNLYPDGANVKNLSNKAGGTVELTAQWANPMITLPSAERAGFELIGWSKVKESAAPEYIPGEKVMISGDTEFYAVWRAVDFNVSYIGNEQDFGNDFTEYGVEQQYDYIMSTNLDGEEKHFTKEAVVSFSDSLSGEVIEENTTKTVAGWSFASDNDQNMMYEPGTVISASELYRAAEAAGNITKGMPADTYNTYPLGADGSENGKPADAAEEYINLYAVWDCGAVIEAYDLYYTLEEAQTGKITMDELLSHAKAYDREAETAANPDGILAYGEDGDAGTTFVVEDYDESELQGFMHAGSITETYLVKDKAENMTRRQITVHIVDTSAGISDPGDENDIRFISREYLDTLEDNSVWRIDEAYHQVLVNTFSASKECVKEWRLSHEEIETVKKYVQEYGFGNFIGI